MRTVLTTVVALLVGSTSAYAAPFTVVGAGALPGVAVDPVGTAYIVWNGSERGAPPHFCRLPRGASACDLTRTLPVGADTDTISRPIVSVAGARVTVIAYRYGPLSGPMRYTSPDGGVTFGGGELAGRYMSTVESGLGPGDTVSVVSEATGGSPFQNISLAPGAPPPA